MSHALSEIVDPMAAVSIQDSDPIRPHNLEPLGFVRLKPATPGGRGEWMFECRDEVYERLQWYVVVYLYCDLDGDEPIYKPDVHFAFIQKYGAVSGESSLLIKTVGDLKWLLARCARGVE